MVASIRSCVASSWVVYLGTIAVFAGCAVASAFSGDQSLGTITTLAWSPRAFLFHGFATREECEHVRALARPYMQRSTVVGDDDEDAVSSVRTSYGTFLSRFQDGTLAALEERIALWTHLNVTHQEDPQVLRYAPGQEYKAHMDDLEEEVPRIATVILYLSDVEMGGETVFPLRNISVSPKMGDALLFWSLDGSMQEDQYALHAGAPVQRGVKWTMTVWIHSGPFRPETLGERLAVRGFPQDCADYDSSCDVWAAQGECTANRVFMVGELGGGIGACRLACKVCRPCKRNDRACEDENRVRGGYLPLFDGSDDR